MENQSDAATDVRAIHSTLNQYAFAIDTRDWPKLKQLFDENSVTVYHGLGEFLGPDAAADFVRRVITQCGVTQHLIGTVDIEVDGAKGTARSYLQAIHIGIGENEGKRYTVWGEYRDTLEKRGERWVFLRRELHTLHSEGDIGITLED
ncbi:MAG: nuclear transport factor 2 family protein [Chromatocurvus sp.]